VPRNVQVDSTTIEELPSESGSEKESEISYEPDDTVSQHAIAGVLQSSPVTVRMGLKYDGFLPQEIAQQIPLGHAPTDQKPTASGTPRSGNILESGKFGWDIRAGKRQRTEDDDSSL
jgi:hypothetical protein